MSKLRWLALGVLCGLAGAAALRAAFRTPEIAVPAYELLTRTWPGRKLYFEPEQEAKKKYGRYRLFAVGDVAAGIIYSRAKVEGTVTAVVSSADGDVHVNIRGDDGVTLVTEIVPEVPLPIPAEGARIQLWGFVREDVRHDWWEIHPVMGWQPVPASGTGPH